MVLLALFLSLNWSHALNNAALAKIGDAVVTTRDLQINQFLNEIDRPLAPFMDKKDPLRELAWEVLIYKESQNVLDQGVSSGEIQSYLVQFKKRNNADKLWNSLEVGDKILSEQIKRKLTVKKLIALKMPADLVSVDDESIETYYTMNKTQLGHRPLEEVREKIVKGLKEQKMQERFRDWMAAITRTHGVVYYSGVKIQ